MVSFSGMTTSNANIGGINNQNDGTVKINACTLKDNSGTAFCPLRDLIYRRNHTATFIAGIHGATAANGVAAFIEPDGHLGTVKSSVRFKEAIQPMDKISESILALKPVSFRYKQELDPAGIPQFGLVAEEVEKVNPDLVARDKDGKLMTVRYEAVNAMLLNEFLKEHRKVGEQQATIVELKSVIAQEQKEIKALAASLEAQAAAIQKVSTQLEINKTSPLLASSQ